MTEFDDAQRAPQPPAESDPPPPEAAASTPPPGAETPPGAADATTPPPPGPQTPPPGYQPPPSGAFAARYGLVRPRTGRYLAGVSGALSRATNTDPVLWRVLFVVLTFFGGFGILAYIVLWLGTPADGDTASPAEALFGRGRSSTSSTLTVIAGAITLLIFFGTLDDRPWPVLWFLLIAAAIVFAVYMQRNRGARPPAPTAPAAPTAATPPAGSTAAHYPAYAPSNAVTEPIPPVGAPVPPPTAPGYQPAFAPHGPFAGAPTPPPLKPLKPPKLPKEHSRLGSLIFSIGLVVLGLMGLLDVANVADISAAAYVAAALGVVGFGLVLGAWLGRARGWIFIGLGLVLALSITSIDERDRNWDAARNGGGEIVWQPTTLAALRGDYEHKAGSATLDLTDLDFTGQERTVRVKIQAGNLQVLLPDKVDVTAVADVRLGSATIFDRNANGVRINDFTVTDLGTDGEGGGKLHLELDVSLSDAEVYR
ncbi:MAG: PspC domain-containing protein [Hamadaea sp.]|uniref:PspC domain-containing protein n=1 Tax=Hamadaea sp. TaxID=2024425 RepID=UPI0017CEEFA4|nr:PspC domain-containing protein [Hamadaea sp.]NUT23441.1 PspC domain-containing protein [Hamadaea sp.]